MGLQTEQKKLLAPQGGATLLVDAEGLGNAGFEICIIKNKPCPGAVAIYPARDREAIMLGCSECPAGPISVKEAVKCIHWEKFVTQ